MLVKNIRIYLLMTGGQHWIGGVQYTRNLIRSISCLPEIEQPSIVLSLGSKNQNAGYEQEFSKYDFIAFEGQAPWVRTLCGGVRKAFGESACKMLLRILDYFDISADKCEVAYPVKGMPLSMNLESVLWIPDFQYKCLPQYFSDDEIARRNQDYARMLAGDEILVLSSESVRKDFYHFFPEYADKNIRVLNFVSVMESDDFSRDPGNVCKKFNLPEKFVYLPNQFFMHKRHDLVFEALAKLKQAGKEIVLVCTGNCSDYRAQDYYQSLLETLKNHQIENQVFILGLISRSDQIQVFRKAAFTLQPSEFEGWSTTVEDGIALGKDMLLSNIDTHIEQNPLYGTYFQAGNVDDLAEKLILLWERCAPGPDLKRESFVKENNQQRCAAFAKTFLDIMYAAREKSLSGKSTLKLDCDPRYSVNDVSD
ncbi:glycosyltransferase [Methylomonas sp. MED-D]|uniref:glycosyltransferase n=1 Tax=unclassified Methylomonas TaxID=2608980 RepID=UPI0028A44112|nr:glycosyltransferase [Methylomonas sp. MV1]MDT4328980.1 glycosyltransferase [Methylomonas sp. MV1]